MGNKLFIIGIDKYEHHEKLSTCKKDVLDFKNVLLDSFDFSESSVYELIDENATNKKIQDALRGYSRTLKDDDNLIIFFSGHGSYSSHEERGFWIPFDGTTEYTTWIPNETIIAFINNLKCKHLFLISDSCFSSSLLNQNSSKSNETYNQRQSRWGLTSAFDEAYAPRDPNSNSLFAESIIEFLENSENEFRISKLIESVKDVFIPNVLQTPQGSPLKVEGHKGGEMILSKIQSIDKRGFKGYNNFLSVLKLYRRNARFDKVDIYENRTIKIGYQLFKELDPVIKRLNYYLYLYEGINQIQTLKYLQENYPDTFKQKNLIIFISKDEDQHNIGRKINNINNKFSPINTFYIDDFIRDTCTPEFQIDDSQSKFLSISNFIIPTFNTNQSTSSVSDFVDYWIKKESDPILVIKGTGGIGKTTFAQYISDFAVAKNPKTTVIFIDSVLIKNNLISKSKYAHSIGLYNFYDALFSHESTDYKLTKEQFELNIDAGNILLVIDGLDEVISKIPNFDIEMFLASISASSDELGKGKVIITCRTHFWNKVNSNNDEFEIIELNPFDANQTKEFFEKSFNLLRQQQKAIKLSEQFKFPNSQNEYVYHPYVLDIIRSIVNSETEEIEMDLTKFNSKLLSTEVKTDYIIYRVCDRERKRIGQISVDEQVEFFMYLANKRRGNIQTLNFKSEIEAALNKHVDEVNIEAFKAHPFLQNVGNTTSFKYDFFSELFKSLYISKYFNYNSENIEINNYFFDIISENCWYGSGLNVEIVRRIKSWTEYDVLLVSDIIDQVSKNSDIAIETKRAVIANIFNISLSIQHNLNQNNIISNTELLRSIFKNSNSTLVNLCLINLNHDKSIRFDFSGLKIEDAFIDNYGYFYECTFDDDTVFSKCYLLNIESKKANSSLPMKLFVDCIYDKNIEEAISLHNNKEQSNIDKSKSFINSFLHLFYSNGRLGRQWEDKVIKPRFIGVDIHNYGYKKVMRIMKRHELIQSSNEKEGIKLFINQNYKEDVIRFVKDGTVSKIITQLISDLC